jgi:predicted 3-demethylubiquinone-9 3-methyltransferase (glyoxalase superfamily)
MSRRSLGQPKGSTMPALARKITPFLWFDTQAEEAAIFYTTIFKNSRINQIAATARPAMRRTAWMPARS